MEFDEQTKSYWSPLLALMAAWRIAILTLFVASPLFSLPTHLPVPHEDVPLPCYELYHNILLVDHEQDALSLSKQILNLGVCVHNRITEITNSDFTPVLLLYKHSLDVSSMTYALPFVTIAAVALNNGDAATAKSLINEYKRGVGFGDIPPTFDADAREVRSWRTSELCWYICP